VIYLFFAGLLQSPGQRQAAQAAGDRQGQVLQSAGGGEDQGSGRSLCADGINVPLSGFLQKINCINGTTSLSRLILNYSVFGSSEVCSFGKVDHICCVYQINVNLIYFQMAVCRRDIILHSWLYIYNVLK